MVSTYTLDLMEHLGVEHPDVKMVYGMTTLDRAVTGDGSVLLLMDL